MSDQEIVQKIRELLNQFPTPRDMDWLFGKLEGEIKKSEKNIEYQRKYYQDNKEILDAKHAEYRKNNPDYRKRIRDKNRNK